MVTKNGTPKIEYCWEYKQWLAQPKWVIQNNHSGSQNITLTHYTTGSAHFPRKNWVGVPDLLGCKISRDSKLSWIDDFADFAEKTLANSWIARFYRTKDATPPKFVKKTSQTATKLQKSQASFPGWSSYNYLRSRAVNPGNEAIHDCVHLPTWFR